jgi:glucan phosphoethanolaminetransferase (alkaline phosphatase superfamily)
MNLDDLKEIWQNQPSSTPPLAEADIRCLLSGRAGSLLDKFRRNLILETLASFVFLGFIFLRHHFFEQVPYEMELISFITLFFIVLYGAKYYQLRQFKILPENDLRSILTQSIKAMRQYLRLYFYSGMGFVLTSFFLPLLFVVKDKSLLYEVWFWLIYVAIISPLVVLFGFFFRWYIKKIYGDLVSELSQCLADLDEEQG